MEKMFLAVLFLVVSMFTCVAFAQGHTGDPLAQVISANATDAVVSMTGQLTALKTRIAEVEKKCVSATGSAKRNLDKKLKELKKQLDELRKGANCAEYQGDAQTKCLELTSEGTNQRLIEAYEETLVGKPASVQTNADGSTTATYPVAQPGAVDNGGSEIITIAEGPNGSYRQVKRVRYAPLPVLFPSVVGKDDGGVHPIVKWLVPVAAGALAGGAIAGMADPDGPDNGNYSFGSAGKGAMLGAATGLAFSLIWEIAE